MSFKKLFMISGIATLCLSFIACNGSEKAAIDVSHEDSLSASSSDASATPRSIAKASVKDIEDNLAPCNSRKDKGKICVYVCHRPPGNPANSKTMILPLSSTLAHLKHGHSLQPDTVGLCGGSDDNGDHDGGESDDEDDEDSGSTTGGSTAGGSGTGGSTSGGDESGGSSSGGANGGETAGGSTSGGGTVTIPDWCLTKYEYDKNCDGFDDDTGLSLY